MLAGFGRKFWIMQKLDCRTSSYQGALSAADTYLYYWIALDHIYSHLFLCVSRKCLFLIPDKSGYDTKRYRHPSFYFNCALSAPVQIHNVQYKWIVNYPYYYNAQSYSQENVITRNDCSLGCPIICIYNVILFLNTSTMVIETKVIFGDDC